MAKQITDIMTPWSKLTRDQKTEIVAKIRKDKYEIQPARVQPKKTSSASSKSKRVPKSNATIKQLINSLTPEQQAKLLKELGQ